MANPVDVPSRVIDDYFNEKGIVSILETAKAERLRLEKEGLERFIDIRMSDLLMYKRQTLVMMWNIRPKIKSTIEQKVEEIYSNNNDAYQLFRSHGRITKRNLSAIFLKSYKIAETVTAKYLELMKNAYYNIFRGADVVLYSHDHSVADNPLYKQSRAALHAYIGFNHELENLFRKILDDDPKSWWMQVLQMRRQAPIRRKVFMDMKQTGINMIKHYAR